MVTLDDFRKCFCCFIQFSFKFNFVLAILFGLFGLIYQLNGIPVLTLYIFWPFVSIFVFHFCFSSQPILNSSKRFFSLVHALIAICFILRFITLGYHQTDQLCMVESSLNAEFKSYSLQNTHGVDFIQMTYECCGLHNKTEYDFNSLPLPFSCCSYNNCDAKENIYEHGCNEKIKSGYKMVYNVYRSICLIQGFISFVAALFFLIDSFTKQESLSDKLNLSVEHFI